MTYDIGKPGPCWTKCQKHIYFNILTMSYTINIILRHLYKIPLTNDLTTSNTALQLVMVSVFLKVKFKQLVNCLTWLHMSEKKMVKR
jgi:hypothetical protein